MITLHLIREPDSKGVYLRLPASPDAESRAFGKLDEISTDVGTTRIAGVTSRVRNLPQYIKSADINTDYEKLKLLAERLNDMTERERHIFSGALDAESINGLDDVLRVAGHLEDYELIEDVICDRDLGDWLVEHDMLGVNFPDAVRPYLDYAGIGAAYYSDHGGAYTLNGYVKRKEVSPKQAPEQDAEQAKEEQAIFTAELSAGKNSEHFAFPASDEHLDRVKEKLAVEDFCGVVVFGINVKPDMDQVMDLVLKDSVTVEDLNEMAICLQEMEQTEGELLKYCSVLEVEKPPTFREAVTIAIDRVDFPVPVGAFDWRVFQNPLYGFKVGTVNDWLMHIFRNVPLASVYIVVSFVAEMLGRYEVDYIAAILLPREDFRHGRFVPLAAIILVQRPVF